MAKERKNHAQEKSAGFEEKLARLQVLSEEIKNFGRYMRDILKCLLVFRISNHIGGCSHTIQLRYRLVFHKTFDLSFSL